MYKYVNDEPANEHKYKQGNGDRFGVGDVVHVRVRWIMETRKHPACTVRRVARLCRSWLSRGTAIPISHGRNSNGTIQLFGRCDNNEYRLLFQNKIDEVVNRIHYPNGQLCELKKKRKKKDKNKKTKNKKQKRRHN